MLELKKPKTTIHKDVERKLNNIVPYEKVPFILGKTRLLPIVETEDGAICSKNATMQYQKTQGDDYIEREDPEKD